MFSGDSGRAAFTAAHVVGKAVVGGEAGIACWALCSCNAPDEATGLLQLSELLKEDRGQLLPHTVGSQFANFAQEQHGFGNISQGHARAIGPTEFVRGLWGPTA